MTDTRDPIRIPADKATPSTKAISDAAHDEGKAAILGLRLTARLAKKKITEAKEATERILKLVK